MLTMDSRRCSSSKEGFIPLQQQIKALIPLGQDGHPKIAGLRGSHLTIPCYLDHTLTYNPNAYVK